MIRRTDIQTLELVPRLTVAMLLAGGAVAVDRVKVRTFPCLQSVRVSWRLPGGPRCVQSISLTHYRPGFGGLRALALCPCGARVASVYLKMDGTAWACRCCLELRYQSQRVHYLPRA